MHKVPIFDLKFCPDFEDKFLAGCKSILADGFLTNHRFVKDFEQGFSQFNDSNHAFAVSNGTSAIEVVLRALEVQGSEVIVQSNTFMGTAAAIRNAGACPVLVDLDGDTFQVSVSSIKAKITPKTKAIVVVHIGGRVGPEIEELKILCEQNNIYLVEDCAQAHGSSYKGKRVGNWGVAGCFSFFTTKIMTTGEGGIVTTNDDQLAEKIISLRQFGKTKENPINHELNGSNFKMNEFSALMGVLELERVQERMAKRQEIHLRYRQNLSGSPWKVLGPLPGGECGYYKQIIIGPKKREAYEEGFDAKGIALTGCVYAIPLHRQKIYSQKYEKDSFPVTDYFSDYHFCPPCYPELSFDQVDYVCETMWQLEKEY